MCPKKFYTNEESLSYNSQKKYILKNNVVGYHQIQNLARIHEKIIWFGARVKYVQTVVEGKLFIEIVIK